MIGTSAFSARTEFSVTSGYPAPLHGGVRSSNHDRTCDRRDAWVGSISDLKRITSGPWLVWQKDKQKQKQRLQLERNGALPSARSSTLKKYSTPPASSETPVYI